MQKFSDTEPFGRSRAYLLPKSRFLHAPLTNRIEDGGLTAVGDCHGYSRFHIDGRRTKRLDLGRATRAEPPSVSDFIDSMHGETR